MLLVVLLTISAGGALLVVFDEAWIRPIVQHWVRAHAGRAIDFRDIAFRLDPTGRPLLRVHDLVIENAPWAAREPLVRASEVELVLDWGSFGSGPTTIDRVRLVDASLDLERQADGLRNWRIGDPGDRGPGRVRLRALDALRTRLRIVDGGLGIDTELRFGDEAEPAALAPAGASGAGNAPGAASRTAVAAAGAPRRSVVGHGTRHGTPFSFELATGVPMTFRDSGVDFGVRGEWRTAHAVLAIDGTARDIAQVRGLDFRLHAEADGRAGWVELAQVTAGAGSVVDRLPALPTVLDAERVVKAAGVWRATGLAMHVGRSDLAGELEYRGADPAAEVPPAHAWRANLRSRRIDIAELRAALAPRRTATDPVDRPVDAGRRPEAHDPVAAAANRRPRQPALAPSAASSAASIPEAAAAALAVRPPRALEGVLALNVQQVVGIPRLPIADLSIAATSLGRAWTVSRLGFGLADGRVTGGGTVDAGTRGHAVTAQLRADGLRLDRLGATGAPGRLDARLDLQARGDSNASLLASLHGRIVGTLSGAALPADLAARLELDPARWLAARVGSGRPVPVVCSRLEVGVDRGLARVEAFALETESFALGGSGTLDLASRRVDLRLTPHRKQMALFALDRSITVAGDWPRPKIALASRNVVDVPAGRCRAS